MKRAAGFVLASVLLAVMTSCVSPPSPTPHEPAVVSVPPVTQEAAPVSPPVVAIPESQPLQPEPEPVTQPEIIPEPEPILPVQEAAQPVTPPESPQPEPVVVETPPPEKAPFDPTKVTQQEYDTTKSDVQGLLDRLTKLIQDKDYDTWISYLTEEYVKKMSDPDYLAQQSESKVLQKFNIRLRSLKDYFFYVVVPSRKVERVDEIVFISETHVKAYMFDDKGEKLLLYELEKKDNIWKIGPGR
jgi:hypothetical protein